MTKTENNPEGIDKQILMDLYKSTVDEVHKYHDLHQKRVAFFSGLIITILAATIAGVIKSTEWYHYLMISLGQIMTITVCLIAIIAINGTHRLLLETVTIRAKAEQALRFTVSGIVDMPSTSVYWQSESLIPERHLSKRYEHESSSEWLASLQSRGLRVWTTAFFLIAMLISGGMLVSTSSLAYSNFGGKISNSKSTLKIGELKPKKPNTPMQPTPKSGAADG